MSTSSPASAVLHRHCARCFQLQIQSAWVGHLCWRIRMERESGKAASNKVGQEMRWDRRGRWGAGKREDENAKCSVESGQFIHRLKDSNVAVDCLYLPSPISPSLPYCRNKKKSEKIKRKIKETSNVKSESRCSLIHTFLFISDCGKLHWIGKVTHGASFLTIASAQNSTWKMRMEK